MRAQFVLREVAIGLRRNLGMTVAVVITVAVSLTMFGAGLLTRAQVNEMKDFWYDKVEVSVFLCGADSEQASCADGAVTAEQRSQIEADLRALPQVERVYYESQQEAYERFKEQFRGTAIAENVTPDSLPESFRVKLKDPTQFDVVAGAFEGRPGVELVQDQRKLLETFFKVLNGLQAGALIVAAFMIVVALLLISNTIRVAAFTRRRETGIMRLVGASNFYIQLPFVLESVLAAVAGALVAAAFLSGIKVVMFDQILRPSFQFTRFIGWDSVWVTIVVVVITAVLISSLASFVTLRRYLRV